MSQTFRPGNKERGWNDPPEFLHTDSSSTTTPQKRTILNQRVAHSFDGKVDETKAENLNDPQKFTAPPISQVCANIESQTEIKNDGEPCQNEISIESLEKSLIDRIQILNDNGFPPKSCDDILKRVKLFSTNWPKLNDKVKQRMSDLVKALEDSDLNSANDMHVRLMLDFPSEVSQWMVGIKKLIYELIELRKKNDQIETNCQESATQ